MKLLKIYPDNINERFISEAVDALRDGNVILYPTDGLYALGVDALNKKAVEKLCRLKGLNPEKHLLSIVCADLSQASDYVRIDNTTFGVLKQYLPGPFTFVLTASTRLPKIFRSRKTIGLRIPDNNISRALADALGNPLLSGSVDIEGDNDFYTDPEALALKYDREVAVGIDGGTSHTEMSTLVDLTDPAEPEVLRQGAGSFS